MRIGRELVEGQRVASVIGRRLVLVTVSALIYAIEAWQGLQLIGQPDDPGAVSTIASLLLPVYAIGVLRSWELVGAERHGLSARFSPLRDLDSTSDPRQ